MAEKDTKATPSNFGGFEALAAGLIKQPGGSPMDLDHTIVDPEDVKKGDDSDDNSGDAGDTGDGDTGTGNVGDGDTGDTGDGDTGNTNDGDDIGDTGNNTNDGDTKKDGDTGKTGDITDDDFKELEPELTTMFRDELGKELNWEFDEDEKFESIGDLVKYMKGIVEESSKPVYANNEIKQLNDFVAHGGNLKDFLGKTVGDEINFDTLDLEDAADQKLIIREHLRTTGLKEDKIKRSLNRYEDADVLSEEAEDALELLKEYKTKERDKLLSDQKNQASDMQKQQQNFYSNVESEIESLKDIRGFKISEKDRKDLLSYIFKPTVDNTTEYQKAYAKDTVKNLIESAYFTKNGDALLAQAKAKASSDAYKQIQKKLKAKKIKKNISSGSQTGGGSSDSFGDLAKTLLN